MFGYGTVFKINKDGTGFRTLHAFSYGDGANPSAELVEGSDSAFYGTALNGGSGGGILFLLAVNCEASIDVKDAVRTPGSTIGSASTSNTTAP